jgi:hypothetical protein
VAGGAPAELEQPPEQDEVLPAAEDLVDGGVLPGQPDPFADPLGLTRDVEAGHRGPARVEAQERAQDAHGGGLAGAVGPEQAVHGSGRNGQVEPVERGGRAVGLADPFGLHGRIGGSHAASVRRRADRARTTR